MSNDSTAVISSASTAAAPTNPHVLWKNVLAIVIAGLVVFALFSLAGLPAIVAGVFTFLDAWHSGIYEKPGSKGFLNLSPGAWGVVVMGTLIIAYPCYAFGRNRRKTKEGPVLYWVLANVFGLLALVMAGLGIMVQLAAAG